MNSGNASWIYVLLIHLLLRQWPENCLQYFLEEMHRSGFDHNKAHTRAVEAKGDLDEKFQQVWQLRAAASKLSSRNGLDSIVWDVKRLLPIP